MIRKFLVIVKQQIFLTSARQEVGEAATQQQVIDVVMPIKVFWQVKKEIRNLDYLNSASATPSEIGEVFRIIFKLIAPYAASEKDRDWLYEQKDKS